MKSYSKATGGFVIALILSIALTGHILSDTKVSSECEDGIDQDTDGNIDGSDGDCWIYPFEDGGGEYPTTTGANGKAWSSDSYEMSLFSYRLEQNAIDPSLFDANIGDDHCLDTIGKESYYQTIYTASGGKDSSLSEYQEWWPLNCN